MNLRNIYCEIIKHCPVIANRLLKHATRIERTYFNGKSIYEIDDKTVYLHHHKIQDNASLFLNMWEHYNEW